MEAVDSLETPLFACGLETTKVDERRYLLCACYELDEASGKRDGCIQTYRIASDYSLTPDLCIQCPAGVLDFKVCGNWIATALSDGRCTMYSLSSSSDAVLQHESATEFQKTDEGMFLSVDYNTDLSGSANGSTVCLSTQSSSILVCSLAQSGLTITSHREQAHKLLGEPMPIWTVGVDKVHQPNRFGSGGDDMVFRLWDMRTEEPLATKKFHSAGVTALQWHPKHEQLFLTGSYDDQCCIWDVRNLSQPLHILQAGE